MGEIVTPDFGARLANIRRALVAERASVRDEIGAQRTVERRRFLMGQLAGIEYALALIDADNE